MKLPGRAWLEFEVQESGPGRSLVRQTAMFDPLGLASLAYWHGIYPLHVRIFAGILRALARQGEMRASRRQAVLHQSESTSACID